MQALILAAGRGSRLRPLTDSCPKPLISVAGKPLIHYHLEKLAQAGIYDVVINQGWLGEQLAQQLGNGSLFGLRIRYSFEGWPSLETGGGIYQALNHLADAPFLVINGDIWTDYDFKVLPQQLTQQSAHLVLVNNPAHHPQGDFSLKQGFLNTTDTQKLTYSGIGIYHPRLFANVKTKRFALAPLLKQAIAQQQITGEYSQTYWQDVGTIERLQQLEQYLNVS